MTTATLKQTPLYQLHKELKAQLVDFSGWRLPIWYTSIINEHTAVRSEAGLFDVSHMGRVWVSGKNSGLFLEKVLTRSVEQMVKGSAQLTLMCLEDGGILDDLYIYCLDTERYLLVWNSSNRQRKMEWLNRWAKLDPHIVIEDGTERTAMVSVQGPGINNLPQFQRLLNLSRFHHIQTRIEGIDALIARVGYTGEDGFELICRSSEAICLCQSLLQSGVIPCGLGARDSLRLEAGMLLYGHDMDTGTNPFEAGLGWLVDLNKCNFVGRNALGKIKAEGIKRKLVGFKMKGHEIARAGYQILKSDKEMGTVTSGGYSPTLKIGIGLGYVPVGEASIGSEIDIMVRNTPVPAVIGPRKFYNKGA